VSLADDFDVKVGVFAAKMNIGGLFLSEGRERATEAMKDVLRHMASSGVISSWGSLSVDEKAVRFDFFIAPSFGYNCELPTAALFPENADALIVMLG
jgi:hypothetical protein